MKKHIYYLSISILIISLFNSSCNTSKNDINLFPIAVGNKMGFIDSTGKVVIECKYDYVGKFNEGLAIAVIDSMYGYIDLSGSYKIKPEYNLMKHIEWGSNDVDGFPEKNPRTQREMFLSHLKSHPDTIYNYDIPDIYNFYEGLAVYYDKGKYGYIGTDGRQIIKAKYTYAKTFSEGLAAVKYNSSGELFGENLYGYINKEDKFVISPQYTIANNFSESKATVYTLYSYKDSVSKTALNNSKAFIIDKNGRILRTPDVQYIGEFKNGYAPCLNLAYKLLQGAGANFIDSDGDYYSKFDELSFLKVGQVTDLGNWGSSDSVSMEPIGKLFPVQLTSGKWGFMPKNFKELNKSEIDKFFLYDDLLNYSEDLAAVKINGRWGFINPIGSVVIRSQYTKVRSFKHGLAFVEQNENGFKLSGYINKSGIMIWSNKSLEKQL